MNLHNILRLAVTGYSSVPGVQTVNTMKKIALFSFVTVLTVSAFHVEPSFAVHPCGGGDGSSDYQVGEQPGGNGVAPIPLCEYYPQQGQGPHAPPPAGDPRLDAATGVLQGAAVLQYRALQQKYEELMRRPFKSAPKNGGWGFGEGKGFCEARFVRKDGMITIFQYSTSQGSSQAFAKGVGLSFIGFGILAPKTEKKVQITFEQTGGTPQFVEAIYTPFGAYIGNLTIRNAPITRDGFKSVPDRADFRVTLDGAPIFTMGWHDAAAARDRLRQCIQRNEPNYKNVEPSPAPVPGPAPAPGPTANNATQGTRASDAPVTQLDFHGTCQSLVIDGEDSTARCIPLMTNATIAGAPGVVIGFGTQEGGKVGSIISFASGEQGRLENGALRQPISYIRLTSGGAQQVINAKGSCLFPNPSVSGVVQCDARTANSTYAARFLTDGNKPTVSKKN